MTRTQALRMAKANHRRKRKRLEAESAESRRVFKEVMSGIFAPPIDIHRPMN